MNISNGYSVTRLKLLSTVSAVALIASSSWSEKAAAETLDIDRPTVWIELGGQAEHVTGQGDLFSPNFLEENANSTVLQNVSPLQAQMPPNFSFGEEGKISIQPSGTNWTFSAGLRYGRSGGLRHVHHQTYKTQKLKYIDGVPNTAQNSNARAIDKFSDTKANRHESHLLLDFSVGRDVGVGLFGRNGLSDLSLGVRFAQFSSTTAVEMRARPDVEFQYLDLSPFGYPGVVFHLPYYQTYHALEQASRNFHGIGPSLSWSGSAPFAGNEEGSELAVDWSANVAVLFGRQKTKVQHQESEHYVKSHFVFTGQRYLGYMHPPAGHEVDRSVAVPNVGASLGVSWRIRNFKVSAGYRADFFLGAIDGGTDTRSSETPGFYGPFATVSIGLGG